MLIEIAKSIIHVYLEMSFDLRFCPNIRAMSSLESCILKSTPGSGIFILTSGSCTCILTLENCMLGSTPGNYMLVPTPRKCILIPTPGNCMLIPTLGSCKSSSFLFWVAASSTLSHSGEL